MEPDWEEEDDDDCSMDTFQSLNKHETERLEHIATACKGLPDQKKRSAAMCEKLDIEMAERRKAVQDRIDAAARAKKSKGRKTALERRKAAA